MTVASLAIGELEYAGFCALIRELTGIALDGSKVYITNGTIADYYVLAARTSPERKPDALSLFLVERDSVGLEARALDKLGNHSSSTALISLDGVRVPENALLGKIGSGLAQLKDTLTSGRIIQATRGLGIAQVAMEKTLQYARERQALLGLQLLYRLGNLRAGVLDELRLIEDRRAESELLQFLQVASQQRVVRDD